MQTNAKSGTELEFKKHSQFNAEWHTTLVSTQRIAQGQHKHVNGNNTESSNKMRPLQKVFL